MTWRQVSIDEERKVILTSEDNRENYEKFQSLLETISLPPGYVEPFPRTEKDSPYISYGIILVHESEDCFSYFCLQRRATIEFTEIIRCGPRKKHLFEYLSNITVAERQLLMTRNHDELWRDLMLEQQGMFKETLVQVTIAFNCFDHVFQDLLMLTDSIQESPPWEFPKGRSLLGDRTQLAAAVRELEEESTIKLSNIVLCLDEVITDIYRGTDCQLYQTDYFVIKMEEMVEPIMEHLDTNCIGEWRISHDMSAYAWVSIPKNRAKKSTDEIPLPDRLRQLLFKLHHRLVK
uniref:Nudix hydrolase domain-containing protein n=1 Tax=viral metagenome TaxID=1070528 RepID=A0A6C0CIY3_9ZZZZ